MGIPRNARRTQAAPSHMHVPSHCPHAQTLLLMGWSQVSPAPEVDGRSRGCLWVPWGNQFQAGMAGGPVLEGGVGTGTGRMGLGVTAGEGAVT